MRLIVDGVLVLGALMVWLIVVEPINGALSSVVGYYYPNYDIQVAGEITQSKIRNGRWGAQFYDIKYSYVVGGRRYSGSKVNFYANDSSRAAAIVSRYPVGRDVKVFVDSASPMFSVLELTPLGFWVWIQEAALVAFWLLTVMLLPLSMFKQKRRMM